MAEILSQDQIDALLRGMSTGQIEAEPEPQEKKPKVKEYDFYSPKKFTKEQLRNIDSIHENVSRLFSSYFSGSMRISSEIKLLQVEEQRYYEFNNALPDTALISLLDLKPKDKNISEFTMMMDTSSNLAYFMVERLLGGSGESTMPANRDYTEIELGIMSSITQKLTGYMSDAWRDYVEVDITLDTVETNPRLIQIYAPEDIVVIVSLEVKLAETVGAINICIPAIGLEELMNAFVSKYSRISQSLSDENKKAMAKKVIQNAIYSSDMTMDVVLDEIEMELEDIMNLQVDDVIKLDKPATADIQVLINRHPWFCGRMGTVKSNKAIKITRSYPQEKIELRGD